MVAAGTDLEPSSLPAKRELGHYLEHWTAHDVSAAGVRLLVQLWTETNEHGFTSIDIRTLADRMGKSAGIVQKQWARLKAEGHVAHEDRGRHASPRRLLLKPAESCVTCRDRREAERAAELADLAHFGLGPVEKLSLDSEPARLWGAHRDGAVRASGARSYYP